eukprot:COSAG05_NODE_2365_length_3171_cov_3.659831_3_plen_218_part_00
MTPAAFERQGRVLAAASGGEWSWVEDPAGAAAGLMASGYLHTRLGQPGLKCGDDGDDGDDEDDGDLLLASAGAGIDGVAEADDPASLHASVGVGASGIVSDVHVVLSPVYQQPVLLFNHSYARSGEPLSHDRVCKLLEGRLPASKIVGVGPVGPVVSQQEHPFLGYPFYAMHGCETSTLMRDVGRTDTAAPGYLLSWLSLVGPVRAHTLMICHALPS